MELNEKIEFIRKEKGYTQELLAEQLGVSRQAVAKWEGGKSFPSTENLIALSQVLEVDIQSLIGNIQKPLLKRPVKRGSIVIYEEVLSFMNRDRYDCEEKYLVSLMSDINCDLGCLTFLYGKRYISIPLGKDKTDWTAILNGIQNGIIPEVEDELDVEDYILNNFDEKQLVEAAEYYLKMNGGRRRDAVSVVKRILCETGKDS